MSSLSHHGIKGQRWGVRRFQNKDGTRTAAGKKRERVPKNARILPKGSTLKRTHLLDEDTTFGGRKYFSTNQEDANKWFKFFGTYYDRVSESKYETTRDLYIAQGKELVRIINNDFSERERRRFNKDVKQQSIDLWGVEDKKAPIGVDQQSYNASMLMQRDYHNKIKSGKKIVKILKKQGFDGLEDDHGKDVAKDPVIIFDPDKKLRKEWTYTYKVTNRQSNGGFRINRVQHTSIDASPYLSHHGIKGQRWGVRRFQNKDGTRTAAGKKQEKQNRLKATSKDYASIRESLSDNDLKMLNYSNDEIKYMREHNTLGHDHIEYGRTAHRVIQKDKNGTPVTYVDATWFKAESLLTGKKAASIISIDLATRAGDEYRGKGHAIAAGKKMVKWFDTYGYKDYEYMEWAAKEENVSSQKTAEKLGFKRLDIHDEGWTLYAYEHKAQHTSIGGTMYIEGNALILGDSSYLEHHGIKGQKWGVRRFQNKDGTRTAAGKKREAENATSGKAMIKKYKNHKGKTPEERLQILQAVLQDAASSSMSSPKEEKELYDAADVGLRALQKLRPGVLTDEDYSPENIDRNKEWFLIEDQTTGMGMISHLIDQKGYSAKDCKDLIKIVDKNYNPDEWNEWTDQRAEYLIFELREGNYKGTLEKFADLCEKESAKKKRDQQELKELEELEKEEQREIEELGYDPYDYNRNGVTHSNLFIEDGTLYLSHHGIRGQRWGVRRFQNRDGSLTNAGRKRLGYATKGAAQTVGKAFKAGVKAGGNAVKAVKAHHEEAEAKKKEKKKEKASKTRLGVMANKDLFTNEEIRKLNERFKLEDEMKMATLQKGVEIAKAVGVIAQNVGTVAKAYEDVTGTSLSPIKKAKQEAEAKEKAEDRKRKLAKEDAEAKRAEDKEKRDIEDRERRIKLEDEDRVRKQAKEDADAQRAENAEKRAQAKERRDSTMAVELQRKAKAAADEQEHKAVKAKAESRSAILDVLEKINKIQDHDDDDHNNNNPPGGGIDTWNDDDYLNFFKKTGIIHSDISDPSLIQNGVLFVDSSDYLAHHGVKGQKWGVRRFQNEDGSLTDKGRKHYEKKLAKAERKKVAADAARGYLERTHGFAVTASAVLSGAAYAAMMVASAANPATIALGTAVVAAMYGGTTHLTYNVNEAWEGRGSKKYERQANEYRDKLKQSDMEEGMYHVENGTLFIDAGEPYLEHHGVLGMKWGKHLRAGKGPADAPASSGGGGGGFAEDDEKLKEMAKKAGMSVAEFRTKMASKLGGAAAKAKKEIGYAYGSEYKKDFEKAARLHENNSKSMHAQAKAAWEGYGESRTAAQKDNWKRYAEYDRQAKASGNMFVKRERSKRAYDNSLASKVDSAKRKVRLTQDKAKSKISEAVDTAKKTRDDVKDNIRSKTGIGVKKDIERNARLAEGQKRRAHELTKQVYSAKSKEDWARAYDESNKESSKAWDNEHRVKKDTKSYPKSIAGRVDSAKRKARLTKDRLKSALGKSRQRKQLTTEGPKAKKKVRIESASAMGFSTNNPYSIPVDARRWGYNGTDKSRVSVGKRGSAPKTILNPKHTDTSHRRKSVGEVMNNARKEQTPGSTPISKPTQYTHTNRPRGREKYFKLGQESKGVKKRSRRVRHFDNSNELYTEGARLVLRPKA